MQAARERGGSISLLPFSSHCLSPDRRSVASERRERNRRLGIHRQRRTATCPRRSPRVQSTSDLGYTWSVVLTEIEMQTSSRIRAAWGSELQVLWESGAV